MSIKLDWEVEADAGRDEIDEDTATVATRMNDGRRWLWQLSVLLLIVLVMAGVAAYQLRQSAAERRFRLETAIAAETTALRRGDRESFMAVQADIDLWRRQQITAFDQYQRGIVATGEIVGLQIDFDQAQVVLREEIDGTSYHVTWFYRRTGEEWRHVPVDLEHWGQPVSFSSHHFDVSYRDVDQPLVDLLTPLLDGWWDNAPRLIGHSATIERPTLIVSSDPALRWQPVDGNTLLIPSSLVQRVPADGSLNPLIASQTVDAVARHWAHSVTSNGQPDPVGDWQWLEEELAIWLRSELAREIPIVQEHTYLPLYPAHTSFLTSLTDAYSPSVVPDLISSVHRTENVVDALVDVTGSPAQHLPVDWSTFIEHRLLAEQALLNQGRIDEATQLFRDTSAAGRDGRLVDDAPILTAAAPGAVTVVDTRWLGHILLVTTEFEPADHVTGSTDHFVSYIPFRVVDDNWRHTQFVLKDWGDITMAQSEHFLLRYYELDGPYAEEILDDLELAYTRLAEAYGIVAADPELIPVAVSPTRSDPDFYEGEYATGSIRLFATSPYATITPAQIDPQLKIRADLYYALAEVFVDRQSGSIAIDHPIPQAFIRWGVRQVDPLAAAVYPPPDLPVTAGPNDIRALWPDRLVRQAGVQRSYYTEFTTAQLLIDKLLTLIGPEVAPALLVSLSTAETLDQWLAPFGVSVDDLYLP